MCGPYLKHNLMKKSDCPPPGTLEYLIKPSESKGDKNDKALEALVSGDDHFSIRSIYDGIDMLPSQLLKDNVLRQCQNRILGALAISISHRDIGDRWRAVQELIEVRQRPEAKKFLAETAKSYPIPEIMARAAQIMTAPEISYGCLLRGELDDLAGPLF